jgi:uncharacterized membrane protein HdeD (DUF308 family)
MIAGIVLIVAGLLIALYPPLLSLIVATLLIVLGIAVIGIARSYRRSARHHDNPVIDLFFRF